MKGAIVLLVLSAACVCFSQAGDEVKASSAGPATGSTGGVTVPGGLSTIKPGTGASSNLQNTAWLSIASVIGAALVSARRLLAA